MNLYWSSTFISAILSPEATCWLGVTFTKLSCRQSELYYQVSNLFFRIVSVFAFMFQIIFNNSLRIRVTDESCFRLSICNAVFFSLYLYSSSILWKLSLALNSHFEFLFVQSEALIVVPSHICKCLLSGAGQITFVPFLSPLYKDSLFFPFVTLVFQWNESRSGWSQYQQNCHLVSSYSLLLQQCGLHCRLHEYLLWW